MEETYGCNLINTKRDGRQVTEFVGKYHVHILVRQGEMAFSDGKNSFTSRQGDLACPWQIGLSGPPPLASAVRHHRHSRFQQCRPHRRGLRHLRLRTDSRRAAAHQRPGMQPPFCIVLNRTNGIPHQNMFVLGGSQSICVHSVFGFRRKRRSSGIFILPDCQRLSGTP